MMTRAPDPAADLPLYCEMDDPVDGLCRVMMLLDRCGIALRQVGLSECTAGGFQAVLWLAGPLPLDAAQLQSRVAAMPAVTMARVGDPDPAANMARARQPGETAQTPRSGIFSRVQPEIRQAPSSSWRM